MQESFFSYFSLSAQGDLRENFDPQSCWIRPIVKEKKVRSRKAYVLRALVNPLAISNRRPAPIGVRVTSCPLLTSSLPDFSIQEQDSTLNQYVSTNIVFNTKNMDAFLKTGRLSPFYGLLSST